MAAHVIRWNGPIIQHIVPTKHFMYPFPSKSVFKVAFKCVGAGWTYAETNVLHMRWQLKSKC